MKTVKSKIFGGLSLSEIAGQAKEEGTASPLASSAAQPRLAAADLALSGRAMPALERENIHLVDPRRCRPWAYHNRTDVWYTKERCQDLIESFAKDGQLEPALARRLVGDKNFDYELIFGMRRRFAAEYTHSKLKVRVVETDDAKAAVLMHIENADRQDITAMERAISFLTQLEAGLFPTQEAMAAAFGVSKGQVTKMLKGAELLKQSTLGQLFVELSAVPVEQAYKLSVLMERPGAREVVIQAASNLLRKKETQRTAPEVFKVLFASLDRSQRVEPIRRDYNLGTSGRMIVTRNAKGKVTVAFPKGLKGVDVESLQQAFERVLKEVS